MKNRKDTAGEKQKKGVTRRGFATSILGGLGLVVTRPLDKTKAAAPVSLKEASYYSPEDDE